MSYGVIYLVTNKINNKKYIGKTCRTLEQRWHEHIYNAYAPRRKKYYFQKALKKYGEQNFIIEQIDEAFSENELNNKEIKWIKYYNSTDERYGYNLAPGGEGGFTTPVCKLSLDGIFLQEYNSISEACIDIGAKSSTPIINYCKGKYNTSFGFQWCYKEDLNKKINQKVKEKKQTNVPVLQYTIDGKFIREWSSVKEAEKTLKIAHSHICAVCRNKRKTANGFVWKYKKEEQIKMEREHIYKRKVSQYTPEGEYVATYDSVEEAAKSIGQKKGGHVSDVCKGKRKKCGGYVWKYEIFDN